MKDEIPSEVRELVRRHITSGDHLEVFMRLHEAGDAGVTPEEVQRATHIAAANVAQCLDDLVSGGLLQQVGANSFKYAPRNTADRQAVDGLAQLYHQRPVTLVRLVYDRAPAPLKSFSEAFRLRDKDE